MDRKEPFDPWRRAGEIVVLQSAFYLFVGVVLSMLCAIWGLPLSLRLVFAPDAIDFTYASGYTPAISFVLAVGPTALVLYHIADRAKVCDGGQFLLERVV